MPCERLFYFTYRSALFLSDGSSIFRAGLQLPAPRYNLDVGSGSHGDQTSKILQGIEHILLQEDPDVVLVEGDTNTVLAGALAAVKLRISIGHVEAGLRSYDRRMPEEINRILTDHCSDFLFAPTENARTILLSEGLSKDSIFVTGNTIVDAVLHNKKLAEKHAYIFPDLGIEKHYYFLVTTHRQENVDDKMRFSGILQGLQRVHEKYQMPIIYPVHPRSRKNLGQFHLNASSIQSVDPLDYLSFLQLERYAKVVLTDSGGVQEESCVLGTPCVTLRDNTERPETLSVGANMLAGTSPERIFQAVVDMDGKSKVWENPYGDGTTGKKILSILEEMYEKKKQ